MRRYVLLPILILSFSLPTLARPHKVKGYKNIVRQIEFWNFSNDFAPVYFGEVTNLKGWHHRCLALAFFKAKNGKIHYAHKMWGRVNGSCLYNQVDPSIDANHVVDNATACVIDQDRRKGEIKTTRRMSMENLKVIPSPQGKMPNVFRIVDFKNGRAGQFRRCPKFPPYDKVHQGALVTAAKLGKSNYTGTTGLVSVKIINGRFKMQTKAKLIYDVNLDYVDTSDGRQTLPTEDVY